MTEPAIANQSQYIEGNSTLQFPFGGSDQGPIKIYTAVFGFNGDTWWTRVPQTPMSEMSSLLYNVRTLCDADGDGFTDSFWFTRQGQVDNSLRTVVGVSVVDNSALLNVNIATRFDPATTAGKTPSDLALVARQDLVVVPPNYPIYFRPNQISSFGPLYLNEVGFFSSPLNVQPIDLYMPTEPPQYLKYQ